MTAPPRTDEVLLQSLREDLVAFTPEAVEDLLGPVAHAALGREQALPARRACRAAGDDPLATLLAVLVLGEVRPRRSLEAALPRTGVDGAVALGVVEAAGPGPDDDVRALVDLRPYAA